MTIERPMFPPRRENPFRLVGGVDVAQESANPSERHYDDPTEKTAWRSRDEVEVAIRQHERARKEYARAAAWAAEAEAQEGLPPATVEQARVDAIRAFRELDEAGRMLILSMGTDVKGLIDLLMYMEKHFSVLPQEILGRSLAFYLLKTVRLSLRRIAKYGKSGPGQ